MSSWNETIGSPIWFIPVSLLLMFCLIEGMHISKHSQYCKTEAQWMNQSGIDKDREIQRE